MWSKTMVILCGSHTEEAPMSSNAFTPSTLVPSWAIAASTRARTKSLALAAFPDALERIFSLIVLGASKALFTAYYLLPVDYQPMFWPATTRWNADVNLDN